MSLNLDAILELLKQHASSAARRVPPGWEIIAREAHRQGVIDGRAIQMESTSQYDAAGASERADAGKDAARYRWLRGQMGYRRLEELFGSGSYTHEMIDARIDAAILAADKEPK
jgi:hypothetical protein